MVGYQNHDFLSVYDDHWPTRTDHVPPSSVVKSADDPVNNSLFRYTCIIIFIIFNVPRFFCCYYCVGSIDAFILPSSFFV